MTDPRYEHPVAGVDLLALPGRIRAAMDAARRELPPGTGVILFAFDFGAGGGLVYIANAERDDCIRLLKEWIAREERLRA
jgi:hypothetical protein